MHYTTRLGDRETQAHVNYKCPCGCEAGLLYDRDSGSEHLGRCCCGRLLWLGPDALEVISGSFEDASKYQIEEDMVRLPWGDETTAVLGVPLEALASEKAKRDAGRIPTKVVDPVCKMMIDPETAVATSSYQGRTHYFCAVGCKSKFDANPGAYIAPRNLLDRLRGR